MSEALARKLVYGRSNGVCERCDQARGQEWQHRKNRSQGGPWAPENGLHLCSPCHRYVTENRTDAKVNGWAVEPWEDPAQIPVLISNGSRWVYLDAFGDYAEDPS